jgi:hypothetical protein
MPAMKILPAVLVFTLVGSSLVLAQQPGASRTDRLATPPLPTTNFNTSSLSAPQVTPELWLYIQEQRRHDDPAQAVRRKAEYQAQQRMTRIASAKWYGYSNSRPESSPIPTMGTYSTGWTGNNFERYQWIAAGTPYMVYGIIR